MLKICLLFHLAHMDQFLVGTNFHITMQEEACNNSFDISTYLMLAGEVE